MAIGWHPFKIIFVMYSIVPSLANEGSIQRDVVESTIVTLNTKRIFEHPKDIEKEKQ